MVSAIVPFFCGNLSEELSAFVLHQLVCHPEPLAMTEGIVVALSLRGATATKQSGWLTDACGLVLPTPEIESV